MSSKSWALFIVAAVLVTGGAYLYFHRPAHQAVLANPSLTSPTQESLVAVSSTMDATLPPAVPAAILFDPYPAEIISSTFIGLVEGKGFTPAEISVDPVLRAAISSKNIIEAKILENQMFSTQTQWLKNKDIYILTDLNTEAIGTGTPMFIQLQPCALGETTSSPGYNFFCTDQITEAEGSGLYPLGGTIVSELQTNMNIKIPSATLGLAAMYPAPNKIPSVLSMVFDAETGPDQTFCTDSLTDSIGILVDEDGDVIRGSPYGSGDNSQCIGPNQRLLNPGIGVIFKDVPIIQFPMTVIIFDQSGNWQTFFTVTQSGGGIQVEPPPTQG